MSDYIIGRNPCLLALKSDRQIDRLLIKKGLNDGSIKPIRKLARERKIQIVEVPLEKLDAIGGVHQGVACAVPAHLYESVPELIARAKEQPPLLVICDGLNDPHNLGSIIRSAEAAGAHGVIIPKNNSVNLNQTVVKCAAGAVMHIGVARVTNLTQLIKSLKKDGFWIFGTDMSGGRSVFETEMTGPAAIVIGSEDKGISRLVKEECDVLVNIPMRGKIGSLNASVAAGIVLFECMRQRGGI